MEPLILKDKRKSQRIPHELTVMGQLDDRRIAMSSDNISIEGMFLFAREFVRPHAVFPARIWLSNEEEPLRVFLTSCFTERTWTGYGIGVHISGISAADNILWESFYRTCVSAHSEQIRQLAESERNSRNQHIVVVDRALSPLAMQAMRKQGLRVSQVPSVGEAIRMVQREPVEAVISDLHRPGLDGLALCCHVTGEKLATRTVLLTSSAAPREFLLGLYAGATRVIAKSCSHEVLAARIFEVLQQPLPSARILPASFSSAATLPAPLPPPSLLSSAAIDADLAIHRLSAQHLAHRASQCLSQVSRYVSDRMARRPGA